jgi:hypothetical protein
MMSHFIIDFCRFASPVSLSKNRSFHISVLLVFFRHQHAAKFFLNIAAAINQTPNYSLQVTRD